MNKLLIKNAYHRPAGWGDDSFSTFMIMAEENAYATFQNGKVYYKRLADIHEIFKRAIDAMHNSSNWFELLFFIKAHSAFLAASRLGLGTQVAEASPLIRCIIENSLYGYFLYKHPKYSGIWLRRHESEANKKETKKIFLIRTMLDELKSVNEKLYAIAKRLYEQSIDYGAHPNEKGLTMALKYSKSEKSVQYDVLHLTDNPSAIAFCLKFLAQSGVLCLKILQLILSHRFKIIGLDIEINNISKGL